VPAIEQVVEEAPEEIGVGGEDPPEDEVVLQVGEGHALLLPEGCPRSKALRRHACSAVRCRSGGGGVPRRRRDGWLGRRRDGRRLPPPIRRLPPPIRRLPPPIRRLPPPIRRLPPPIRRLPPPIRRLPPPVRRLPPPVRRLPPPIRRLPPPIRRLP